jgi:manganese transport protein
MLGPAFVAGVAYVDPGNVATNTSAGSRYGYSLLWVAVGANLVAVLVQYLSAKLGIATGASVAHLARDSYHRATSMALWVQAEAVTFATDLAEVLGGAIALNLLFGLPLPVGGVITAGASFGLLLLQGRTQRRFELVVVALLAVLLVGFLAGTVVSRPSAAGAAGGLVPGFADRGALLLAVGMLGATVMPHAIYLHSALIRDRFDVQRDAIGRRHLLRATRLDVGSAMAVAGAVNVAMVRTAAAALHGNGRVVDSIEGAHRGLAQVLGPPVALAFAVALLASGLASSAVGTYAGAVVFEGFWRRHVPVHLRRAVTLTPAIIVLALGVEPTQALILSQVVLSFGIPFVLFPLVRMTSDATVMRELVNRRSTTVAGTLVAVAVTALNAVLIALTLNP